MPRGISTDILRVGDGSGFSLKDPSIPRSLHERGG